MENTKTDLSGLNAQQKLAVISQNKRLLVLAGAGSGKTRTLLQKLIYLIEEKNVKPSNILAITFTKNAAYEMLDRLIVSADMTNAYAELLADKNTTNKQKNQARYNFSKKYKWIDNLTLKTFHSLCYQIMRDFGVNEFDNKFKIIGDGKITDRDFQKNAARETAFEVVHKILIQNCESNEYLINLKKYILDYMVDKIHFDKNKKKTSKDHPKHLTTLNGVKVRSKSEQYIANWFYRHGIVYEYEPTLNIKDFDFKPDFFIPDANLYIEHVSKRSHPTKDKEKQFEIGQKLLVKTFHYQTKDTNLINQVLEDIVKDRLPAGYKLNRNLSFDEEFKYYHKDVGNFVRQILNIINMMKVDNLNPQAVLEKAKQDQHERVRGFYELAIPIVEQYKAYCTNKSYLDFNDLILKTVELFQNRPEIAEKYKQKYGYILVDEFQDVNNLQVQWLKLLLTKENQLFCVGDDWQSIYGFRGSNVDYIVNFQEHFESSEIIKLSMNYRSSDNIVGASNEVIKHNKFKVEKEVKSLKKATSKIYVYAGSNENENVNYAVEQVRKLQEEKSYTQEDILFLYRRNKMYNKYLNAFKREGLRVSNKTIHSAKGLEAKAVFIIGLTEGSGGFPDIWMEDRIYQVIKQSNHELLLEEERRLFYVAITRAKDQLFLMTEKGNESSFLSEIPESFTAKSSVPFKSVMGETIQCISCENSLDKVFVFCPYCGVKQKESV